MGGGGDGRETRRLTIWGRYLGLRHGVCFLSLRTQGESSEAAVAAASPSPLVTNPTGAEVMGEGRRGRVKAWGEENTISQRRKMSAARVRERDFMHCVRVFCRRLPSFLV